MMNSEVPGRLTCNFAAMNETDVREIIVRPLLHKLGYQHGSEANIRTEVQLKYDKAFLGRKSAAKDPPLVGRADYICEVISYGRWVVEVKAPSEPLDLDTVQQAHTYAAHPEIGATYILLTNGREFALYRTGSLDQPLLQFAHDELDDNLLRLFNVIGPEAVRKLNQRLQVDPGKPLGMGVASRVRIIGGHVTYEEHETNTPLVPRDAIEGVRLPIVGGYVERSVDGRIHAFVEVAKAAPLFREVNEMLGAADDYDFYSADEYISIAPDQPTVLQNIYESYTPAGTEISVPGMGKVPVPFGYSLTAFTQAVGFIQDGVFRGTMQLDYDIRVDSMSPMLRPILEMRLGKIPDHSRFSGVGSFEIMLAD